MIHPDIALHNSADSTKDRLMVVVNPNCKACAKVHRHIREISADISISLVIYTNDRLSVHIAQTILSAYLSEGWDRAIYLLEVWFEVSGDTGRGEIRTQRYGTVALEATAGVLRTE